MIKKKNIIAQVAILAFLLGHALAPSQILSAEKKNDVADASRHFTNKNRRNGKIIIDGKPVLVGVPSDIDLGQNGSYVYFSIEREEYLQGHDKDKETGKWIDKTKVKYYYVALSTSPLWIKEPDPVGFENDTMVFSQKNEGSFLFLNNKVALYGTDELFDLKNVNRTYFFLGTDGGESVIGSKSNQFELSTEYMNKVVAVKKNTPYYLYNETTNKNYLEIITRNRLNYYKNASSREYRKVEILGKSDNVKYMDYRYNEIGESDKITVNPQVEKSGMIVTPEVEKKEEAENDTTREKKEQDKKDKGKTDEQLKEEEKTKGIEYEKYKDGSIVRDKEGNPVVKTNRPNGDIFNFLVYDPETGRKQTQRMFSMFELTLPNGDIIGDGGGELPYNRLMILASETARGGQNIAPNPDFNGSANFYEDTKTIVANLVKPFYYSIFILYSWKRSRTLFGGD